MNNLYPAYMVTHPGVGRYCVAQLRMDLNSASLSSPGANIINTNCSAAHTRQALCCKMSVEYDKFIESQKKCVKHWSGKLSYTWLSSKHLGSTSDSVCVLLFSRWFCHVDDDNYVILPSLLQMLSSYHHSQDVYLGRPSLDHPIEAAERIKSDGSVSQLTPYWRIDNLII